MTNLDPTHLMMIEPTFGIDPEARQDAVSQKMSELLNQAVNGTCWRGWHTCVCGEMSGNYDLVLPNGMITNSLAVHYLERHRIEVPMSEVIKIINAKLDSDYRLEIGALKHVIQRATEEMDAIKVEPVFDSAEDSDHYWEAVKQLSSVTP